MWFCDFSWKKMCFTCDSPRERWSICCCRESVILFGYQFLFLASSVLRNQCRAHWDVLQQVEELLEKPWLSRRSSRKARLGIRSPTPQKAAKDNHKEEYVKCVGCGHIKSTIGWFKPISLEKGLDENWDKKLSKKNYKKKSQ